MPEPISQSAVLFFESLAFGAKQEGLGIHVKKERGVFKLRFVKPDLIVLLRQIGLKKEVVKSLFGVAVGIAGTVKRFDRGYAFAIDPKRRGGNAINAEQAE